MRSNRRLTLRREALADITPGDLAGIAGAYQWPGTGSLALCQFTAGVSCGGVCSIDCGATFTCGCHAANEVLETIGTVIGQTH